MKKILIATAIALSAASASALEVGLTVGTNYAKNSASRSHEPIIGPMQWSNGTDRTEYGITVGESKNFNSYCYTETWCCILEQRT